MSGDPSDVEGDGGDDPSPFSSMTEIFEREFPYFLAYGMTPDQYWYEDPTLTRAYLKKYELEQDYANTVAWLQGAYVYEAIMDLIPAMRPMGASKPTPYRSEPIKLFEDKGTKKSDEQKQQELNKARMEAWAGKINQKIQN